MRRQREIFSLMGWLEWWSTALDFVIQLAFLAFLLLLLHRPPPPHSCSDDTWFVTF